MNSSGIKRGLAGSAITALAIAGLPFIATSANAVPLVDQVDDNDINLVIPDQNTASVQNDGDDSSVNLVAVAGADVEQVTFQWRPASSDDEADWKNIATVNRVGGAFTAEWDPAVNLYNTTVDFRAVGLDPEGATVEPSAGSDASESDVAISPGAESIDIAYAPGAEVGVFEQKYVGETRTGLLGAVSGTTSDTSTNPDLTFNGGGAETTEDVVERTTASSTSRDYSAPVDFGNDYDFLGADEEGEDEAVIVATAGGQDAEPVVLTRQQIRTVNAAATRATVIQGADGQAVITVTDADGNPVVGAQVVRENEAGVGVELDAVYTNSQGQAKFTIDGDDIDANGETFNFYVNVDDENGYQSSKDFRRSVTISNEAQTLTKLTADSNDGVAFDFDENEDGDITVTATDQNGAPVSGRTISYTWSVELFDEDADEVDDVTGSAQTDGDGVAEIPLPNEGSGEYTLNYYVNQDGTPGQGSGDLSGDPLVVTAGEAELEFDEAGNNAAGTTATYEATLELEDGTPLVGRDVAFNLTRNGDDVVLAEQADQPAGTTRATQTTAQDTTDADGAVQVAVTDPANTPPRSEQDAVLRADTVNTEDIGNAQTDVASVEVEFITDQGPVGTTVEVEEQDGTGTPGVAESGSVTVVSNDPEDDTDSDEPVEGLLVTLTVDGDAFFTDSAQQDEVEYEDGDLEGDNLVNLGQEIRVVTDEDGEADYEIAVQGSDEFDDDGEAEFDVTATASGDTDTEEYVFSTKNPLNGGEVLIELASGGFQDSSVLPLLPTTDDAAYDVSVTDQFGNPIDGADVDIDIDGVGSAVTANGGALPNSDIDTDFNDNAEFYISSNVAGDSTPVGSWDAPSSVYDEDSDSFEDSVDDEVEGEGPQVDFYAVDFANSTYTLAQQGPETVPVGTTVIMDYTAVDQNGEPIEFSVDFFRTGPDDFQDGDPNNPNPVATGEDGMATYVFSGAAEGTATVTAIGYVGDTVVPASQATDTVTFGKKDDEKAIVEAIISADSNGPKKDVVRFQVDDEAEGATVKLFKIRGKKSKGNKRLVQVREDIVPEGGTLTFKVADRNGNQKTRFIAKVSETDISQKAKSNTQKPR